MRKLKFGLLLSLIAVFALPFFVRAENLADRLPGRILLQVESKGEAWYVDPSSKQRIFLGRPDDIFQIMRDYGLGVKKTELQSYLDTQFPQRLAGRIMLNVEGRGEAYYVSPDDRKGHYLGSPQQAFQVVKEKAIGISNDNIEKINVISTPANKSASVANTQAVTPTPTPKPENTASKPETTQPVTPAPTPTTTPVNLGGGGGGSQSNTCSSWTYSQWSECQNGVQTREVLSALPAGCTGGAPEISKSCTVGVCTSWHYSEWGNCSGGVQLRQVTQAFPIGCTGGLPAISKTCGSDVQCTAWTYSDWSPCTNGTQTRTVVTSSPDGCVGGQPVLSQTCDNTTSNPYSPYQFSYGREMGPQYDPHVRIVFLSPPSSDIKILKIPVTAYYSYGTLSDTLPADLSYSVNFIQNGEQKSIAMTRLSNREFVFEAGEPIPLNLGDNNSLTIKANMEHYSAMNDVKKWLVWDYSVDKPVWTGGN